jgi:outer membrane receptor protein involved in Fe transport
VPKATLTYKFTPDVLVYATYSKGFRPGGANRVGGNTYAPDYLQNYEIGWKTQWFDHRLRWNGALFWEDWKNLQFAYLVPPSINAIANGGTARVKGIESELQWAATNNLMLSGGFTLIDPVLTQNICQHAGVTDCPNDFVDNQPFLPPTFPGYGPSPNHPGAQNAFFGPLALSGNNLPVAPKFKGNLVARYTVSAWDWAPFGQAALVYQSKTAQLITLNQAAVVGDLGAYALIDLTAGVSHNGLNIEAFVSNVADKRAQLSKFTETNAGRDNQVYTVPAQPRTFGLRVSQSF